MGALHGRRGRSRPPGAGDAERRRGGRALRGTSAGRGHAARPPPARLRVARRPAISPPSATRTARCCGPTGTRGCSRPRVAPHFKPGALCSEAAVGTNAVGTALALGHPVQIFSAEHFNRLLHGWTCAAAPVRDPATGATLGAIDLSSSFRNAHPHTLALVTAVAKAAEAQLGQARVLREAELLERYVDRLPAGRPAAAARSSRPTGACSPSTPRRWLGRWVDLRAATAGEVLPTAPAAAVEPLGGGARIVWGTPGVNGVCRAACSTSARSARDVEVELLGAASRFGHGPPGRVARRARACHPRGLTAQALAEALYGPGAKPVTVRAEVARLRRLARRADRRPALPAGRRRRRRLPQGRAPPVAQRAPRRRSTLTPGPCCRARTCPRSSPAARARERAAPRRLRRLATLGVHGLHPPAPWLDRLTAVASSRPRVRRRDVPSDGHRFHAVQRAAQAAGDVRDFAENILGPGRPRGRCRARSAAGLPDDEGAVHRGLQGRDRVLHAAAASTAAAGSPTST